MSSRAQPVIPRCWRNHEAAGARPRREGFTKFATLENDISENVAAPRFRTLLFGVFAGLAVCLAMAGVYGVMAYAVGQQSMRSACESL